MSAPWRVAVYAVPGLGADPVGAAMLERAEAWLGRAADGRSIPVRSPAGWSRGGVDELTADARRYGFHGTLKAPFRLSEGSTLDELDEAVGRLAATCTAVTVPQIGLERIGRFFAFTPGAEVPALRGLADEVVERLDGFRAPLTEPERARRRPETLTERQRQLLERWGYPYVFDEWRFHLTLTDRIPPERQDEVDGVLRDWFAAVLGRDLRIDVLAVVTEERPGAPFRLHRVHAIQPTAHDLP